MEDSVEHYRTMTVGGIYGQSYDASCDADAVGQARADGYTVLDVTDDREGPIIVIE